MWRPSRRKIGLLEDALQKFGLALVDGGGGGDLSLSATLPTVETAAEDKDEFDEALFSVWEAVHECFRPPLCTPRKRRMKQAELPKIPTWYQHREQRSDLVYFRHLGVNIKVFDALCHHMRELLPAYDPSVVRKGARTRLDYVDVTALCLRRLQLAGEKWLETLENEFGANCSVLRRALGEGRAALLLALRRMPAAAIRPPTKEEAKEAWKGFCRLHGLPPWHVYPECWEGMPFPAQGCDGTDTPAERAGDDAKGSEQNGGKGVKWIHVLATCINGTITDFAACVVGSFNDSRISTTLMERFLSQLKNPESHYMVLDNGWKMKLIFPLPDSHAEYRTYQPGQPFMMRPMKDCDAAPVGLKKYYERCSAYVTIFRQHGEWTNGGLKVQFPFIMNPRPLHQRDDLHVDFETVRVYQGASGPPPAPCRCLTTLHSFATRRWYGCTTCAPA